MVNKSREKKSKQTNIPHVKVFCEAVAIKLIDSWDLSSLKEFAVLQLSELYVNNEPEFQEDIKTEVWAYEGEAEERKNLIEFKKELEEIIEAYGL